MPSIRSRSSTGADSSTRGFFLLLVCWTGISATAAYMRHRSERPDLRQRIGATLVEWGQSVDGLAATVPEEEVHRHVELLWSPNGEERVRAAWWLGERGVRQAGPQIAAAMADGGTLRPCQLAHNLGKLGDDRWIGQLIEASRHPTNLDLRVCATDALGDLSSTRAIDGLIDVYRRDLAAVSALEALGTIAEPGTLPFLRSVAEHPRNKIEQQRALRAIERAQIMAQADPVPALIRRVEDSARGRFLDDWAVRKLVHRGDDRAVSVFAQAIGRHNLSEDDQIMLAAALLTLGKPGMTALRNAAASGPALLVAQEAISWSQQAVAR
ncbi:MAG: hypothetical protein WEC36_07940 [Phycisphaeraceae bacterium]